MKKAICFLYAQLASAVSWGYGHYLTDSDFFKWLCVIMALTFAGIFTFIYFEEDR